MPTEIEELLAVIRRPERPRTMLEERVQAIEDREQVRQLLMAYGYLCDARSWEELLEHYTDDVERVLGGTLEERATGKEALRRLYEAPVLPRAGGAGESTGDGSGGGGSGGGDGPPPAEVLNAYHVRHLITGEIVRLSDDGAEAWAAARYSLAVTTEQGGHRRGVHEGAYVMGFRKEGGTWRVARMVVFSDNAHNPLFQRSSG